MLLAKPILKNKTAVENEIRSTEPKQKGGNKKSKEKGKKGEEDESLSAYFKVNNFNYFNLGFIMKLYALVCIARL